MSLPASATAVSDRYGNGTHTATSAAVRAAPRAMPASSSALAVWLPCIFQLPTTSLRRIVVCGSLTRCSTILPTCVLDSISACACGRLGGREHLVDHRLDAAGLEQRPHLLAQRARRCAALKATGRGRSVEPVIVEPLAQHGAGVELALRAALHRDDREAAVVGQALDLARDVVAGHHVEHDVDAAACRSGA